MWKDNLLWKIGIILFAIGLTETNHIACTMSWNIGWEWNWIDVRFTLPLFGEIIWLVNLWNCIIIFWGCLWIAFIIMIWDYKHK